MKRRSPYPIVRFILLALYLLGAIFPLYWIFITSLKGPKEIYTMPLQYLPSKACWQATASLLLPELLDLFPQFIGHHAHLINAGDGGIDLQ